ncbi:MAG: alpha/beta fold hydrolase [Comamonadaceae bacterium]|nr:alpha/beta fold hydrolase [Comamonadaceae bacterium]
MSTSHLLYLHGFRSSPQSAKARQMGERVAAQYPGVTWWCPQLPPSPAEAAALIDHGTKTWPTENMAIVGSSLGGFYATWLAQRRACRAVLLNPAVNPARDLAAYIGELSAWHDPAEQFFFRSEYIEELRNLESGEIRHPERIYALIAKGDELLDWREMFSRYAACHIQLLEGSDHALSDFELHLGQVLEFLRLRSS